MSEHALPHGHAACASPHLVPGACSPCILPAGLETGSWIPKGWSEDWYPSFLSEE